MNSWEVGFFAACAVIALLCGVLVWVSILAREAQKAKDEALQVTAAQNIATSERAMSEANANATPTDQALDASLSNGTFVVLLLLPLALGGCVTKAAAPCPVLVTYSKADDLALKAELDASQTPVIHRFIRDYGGLRAQVRVCETGQ